MSSISRRLLRYEVQPATKHATTPTANYVITPKTVVCPGTLSKNLNQKFSIQQQQSLRSQQRESSKQSSIKLSKSYLSTQVTPTNSITVNPIQGELEIHLKHLDICDKGFKTMERLCGGRTTSLRLSWKFLTFERTIVTVQSSGEKHVEIESSVLYKIDMNEKFYEYMLSRSLSLELFGKVGEKETYLARGVLTLTDALENPLSELLRCIDLCDIDKALVLSNTGIAVVYGTLTLWYRLTCDVDALNMSINKVGHIYYSPSTAEADRQSFKQEKQRNASIMQILRNPNSRTQSMFSGKASINFNFVPELSSEESESISSLEPTDLELSSFQEALDLVLSRNKALRITQSEISNEMRDRARWLHEEANWKRTLQEHAILCGKDPAEVQWRQWRTPSTANVKLRNYKSQTIIYKPEVVITIEYVKLYKDSPPIKNNKFKKFYVEYSFLTHDGIEMECPFSVPKSNCGKRMVYNFTKQFVLDLKENSKDCYKLAESVRSEESLVFVVVGEPEENSSLPTCCEEVTSGIVNMLQLVEQDSNQYSDMLPLYDLNDENHEIGYMKVRISGVQVMRRLALQLLAPIGYTILE